MSKRIQTLTKEQAAAMTSADLREQSEYAESYARSRPANDLAGFMAAMRDAETMRNTLAARRIPSDPRGA